MSFCNNETALAFCFGFDCRFSYPVARLVALVPQYFVGCLVSIAAIAMMGFCGDETALAFVSVFVGGFLTLRIDCIRLRNIPLIVCV